MSYTPEQDARDAQSGASASSLSAGHEKKDLGELSGAGAFPDLEGQQTRRTQRGAHTGQTVDLLELNDGVPRQEGVFRKLWALMAKLDRYGVEARGIERVPEEERFQKHVYDITTLWTAANTNISSLALGMLGVSLFELSLRECVLVIVFFNLLSTLPVAYFSIFGARTGLRQMIFSRFSFGYYCLWIPAVLNVIATIGWSVINSIAGSSCLSAVNADSGHNLPIAVGIIIVAILTFIPTFAGYKLIHAYERWSAIIPAAIFIILLGQSARYMVSADWSAPGSGTAANILSFGGAIVGFGIGWSSYAADYCVNLPHDTSGAAIFFAAYTGLNVPLILIETLGAALMTTTTVRADFNDAYTNHGLGGLINYTLGQGPHGMAGFGSFLTILLGLSVVANNIPNLYSLSLTVQIFGKRFQAVPRFIWVSIGTAVYIVLAIVGASHFEAWLDTLLVLLAYWLVIYCIIVTEEHLIFRRGRWSNYDLDAVNDASRLPLGVAAFIALACGIAGAVLGMAQTWYIGVIGRKFDNPFGGDVGFELALGFAGFTYPVVRAIEKKLVGR